MNKNVDADTSDLPDQTGREIVSLLLKMKQQLLFLEKKIDTLIEQSMDKSHRGKSSIEKPFRKKTFSKPFRSSGQPRRRKKEEKGKTAREKESGDVFYSRYRKGKSKGKV